LSGEPTIRAASFADADLLWLWSNDADTRRWSFDPAPIPWETHVAWLRGKLADPASRIFLVVASDTPRAAVRFEPDEHGAAVVSIVVDPRERGRGWGARALRLSCQEAARELGLRRVDAYIQTANRASITTFERAGFVHAGDSGRVDALKMIWYPGTR
jgi:RimJ/RimL family protein N-acetyltransferase